MKALLQSVAGIFALAHLDMGFVKYTPPRRVGPKPTGGAGVQRAHDRLRAKLIANQSIPSGARWTRQQERQAERGRAKSRRSNLKRRAMKEKLKGGAAAV